MRALVSLVSGSVWTAKGAHIGSRAIAVLTLAAVYAGAIGFQAKVGLTCVGEEWVFAYVSIASAGVFDPFEVPAFVSPNVAVAEA